MADTANPGGQFEGFNEDNAVDFIRAAVPENVSERYSDDEILYVVDTIWDFYDKRGLTSLDDIDAEEELLDVDDLTLYVKKQIVRDKEILMDPKDVETIVKAELDYEKSLEDLF